MFREVSLFRAMSRSAQWFYIYCVRRTLTVRRPKQVTAGLSVAPYFFIIWSVVNPRIMANAL